MKGQTDRPLQRWENNIKTNLKETCEDVSSINIPWDRDWRSFVITKMNEDSTVLGYDTVLTGSNRRFGGAWWPITGYWSTWWTMSFLRSYAAWSCGTQESCAAGDSGLRDVTQSKSACSEERTSTLRNIGDDEHLHIDTTSGPGKHETCMVLVFL
jgi:hypothetical protein